MQSFKNLNANSVFAIPWIDSAQQPRPVDLTKIYLFVKTKNNASEALNSFSEG